jgi:hypothetical protein
MSGTLSGIAHPVEQDSHAPALMRHSYEVPVSDVNETLRVSVVLADGAGNVVIVVFGATAVGRVTVMLAEPAPNELVHVTVIVFGPLASATELVDVLVDGAPLTVQVVPPGIVVPPLTV